MIYELDDIDRVLIVKCRKAREYYNDGDPVKDVMDEDELAEAMCLLLNILDAEEGTP